MMTLQENPSSPGWSTNTKLVVGLALAGITILLLIRFHNILAPLLTSVLVAYLFHPIATFFNKKLKIPWRLITTILFLLLFAIIIGLLTWGGISIVEQVQNLIKLIQGMITDLPGFFEEISSKPLVIGPFEFDLSKLELETLWTQVAGIVQPLLAQLGSLIGSLATGIGSTLTWLVFILLIAYFILSESNKANLIRIVIPRYQEDIQKIVTQLGHIWNAFLRGQLLIFVITVAYYALLLSVLGVKNLFLLAFLAGLARFVPYVGPFVAWTTYGLVALFQTEHLGMQPLPYALLVVGCAWFSDFLLDNFVVPRVMSDALAIHPAAVLVMVIISASLFGFLGILLAAPVLASIQLIVTYLISKLADQDPWLNLRVIQPPEKLSAIFIRQWQRTKKAFLRINIFKKDTAKKQANNPQQSRKKKGEKNE